MARGEVPSVLFGSVWEFHNYNCVSFESICKESSKNVVDLREANQGNCQLTFSFFLCFSITSISNLFTNEPNDRKFVHNPPISEANWFRMIVNLIN